MKRGQAVLAVFMVFVVALSVAAPAIAATSNDPVTDHLVLEEHDSVETAPNPYINGTRTVAAFDLSEGRTDADLAGYEDDNGNWIAGSETPFEVNTTHDIETGWNVNPYTFAPGHIEDSSRTAFPDKEDRTWANASRWSKAGANSSKLSAASNTTAAVGVDGVRFQTGGGDMGSGDTGHWNFSAWDGELDSDESKRVLQVAMDVDTLESGANFTIRVYDEDDDHKEVLIDDGGTVSGNVFATSTGDSKVFQIKLSKLATTGGGSWDNIEKVSIIADDGDVDVTVSWLDLRKKAKDTLGEKRATTDDDGNDGDGDGDYDEFQTIYNATGDISVHSMETLDTEYDDAVVHDLQHPFRYEASGLDEQGEEGSYVFQFDEASNPGFEATLNVTYALELPDAVDLSYSNTDVLMVQKWPESRYLDTGYAEAVAGSTNLSEATTSSFDSTLASQEDELSLDSTSVDAGDREIIHYEIEVTADERAAIEATAGGAGAPAQQGGGGLVDMVVGFFTSTLGIVLTAITGVVIWLRRRG